ncbi:hypothetical protein ACFXG4_08385 [Nocardia sp. NPDC059246]|uniref:hypothetical protein n=1 Tax=Nocardia sp. NPDC059246 TaxID=3346789 RepID=UPI0036A31240
MTTTCWNPVRARTSRLTKVSPCGEAVAGAKNSLAFDGFVTVEFSPEYEDGQESSQKKANGELAWITKDDDQLKWVTVAIEFTGVNPDAVNLILGQPTVLDHLGNAVGFRLGQVVPSDWAIETWTDIPGMACAAGKPYGYFLAPWLHGGKLTAWTLENGGAKFKIEGARTQAGSLWGKGPYDVDLNAGATEADPPVAGKLLTPIGGGQHVDMHITFVAPPQAACAATALVIA